jgi:hypothetical protein
MRALVLRVVVALPALALIYFGWYWASRSGGGCARPDENKLALIGDLLIALGAGTVLAAVLGRLWLGAAALVVGIVLLVIGLGIGLSCLA